jgi:hypothetical protein
MQLPTSVGSHDATSTKLVNLPEATLSSQSTTAELLISDVCRRGHYVDYNNYIDEVDEIFASFREDIQYGFFLDQSRAHPAIPYNTIRHWYQSWKNDPDWRPYSHNRAMNHRVLTNEQEDQFVEELRAKFWNKDAKLSSRTFKQEASTYWITHRKSALNPHKFASSNHFQRDSLQRHSLSLRTPTVKTVIPQHDDIVINEFLERLQAAKAKYGPDLVINMDETSWRDIQLAGKTITQKGTPSVTVLVKGNAKSSLSAVCTVSMSGNKFPPSTS